MSVENISNKKRTTKLALDLLDRVRTQLFNEFMNVKYNEIEN